MEKLVIDTETTGLSPYQHNVLTVGMLHIKVNKDFLRILNSNHILVKHQYYSIDPQALIINNININEHHKRAIYPDEACKKINNFIEQNSLEKIPLVGHNIKFDKGFLHALFQRENLIPKFYKEEIDTMLLWNRLKNKGIVPFHLRSDLQTVAEFFQIDSSNSHNALEDCKITARVYQEILKKLQTS